jgi:hypothetical protein
MTFDPAKIGNAKFTTDLPDELVPDKEKTDRSPRLGSNTRGTCGPHKKVCFAELHTS